MARPKIHDKGLRDALLEGAARTVAGGGVDGLVMRRLAAEHGTSTSAIYALFGGKQELLDAVIQSGAQSQSDAICAVVETDDPGADLRNYMVVYSEWAMAHPDLYAAMFGGRFSVEGRETHVQGLISPGLQKQIGTLSRLAESGRLVGRDPHVVATSIWAAIHGFIELDRKLFRYLQTEAERQVLFAAHVDAVHRAWVLPAGDPAGREPGPSAS